MKEFLKKLIASKKKQMDDLRAKSQASESVEEVRAIGETLQALATEIRDAEEQLAALEDQNAGEGEGGNEPAANEGRSAQAAAGPVGGFNPLATYSNLNQGGEQRATDSDPTSTEEYRMAFMQYVVNGTMSDELRVDANTLTTDVGAVIPTNLINRIIEQAEKLGMILPLVNKTQYPVGQEIPVATLKPTATWVAEGASSDKQKYSADGKVTFTHHKLRCEVSISMEVSVMALSAFESKIVETVSKAMTRAIEQAIIDGDGSGKPKGILKETPNEGQAIALANGTKLSYKLLCDFEAAIPEEYEAGAVYCMSKKTFMAFQGITDANGQPVARVNYGIAGAPERTLLGRPVVLSGKYLPNFEEKPSAATTWGFIFNFEDYTLNTNYNMGIQRRQDWDTEDLQTKAVMAVDGKVTDKGSLVTLTTNAA